MTVDDLLEEAERDLEHAELVIAQLNEALLQTTRHVDEDHPARAVGLDGLRVAALYTRPSKEPK